MKIYKCNKCKFKTQSRRDIRKHAREEHYKKCIKHGISGYDQTNVNTSYESPVSETYHSEEL